MREFLKPSKRGCYMPGGGGGEPEDQKTQKQNDIPEEEK